MRSTPWSFAYRYATLPYTLSFRVEAVKPRIRTEELVEVFLEPEQVTVNWSTVFDIRQAGVFQLDLEVPAGYSVRQVRGHAVPNVEAAAVDSHALEGEGQTRLKVNLVRKAFGRVGLLVELHKRIDDPNLASPTGQTSQMEWPLPRTAMSVESTQGRLVLYAPRVCA